MSYEHTEAIVLRKVDFSETSRIITFLTPYRGRLTCMVKGARRKGSAMGTLLDTYNRLEVTCVWRDGRQVQLLTEAVLLDGYGALKSNVESIACAAFMLEIAGCAAQENNPSPELYDAARMGLEQISAHQAAPLPHALKSIYHLLEASGLAPDATEEAFDEHATRLTKDNRAQVCGILSTIASGEVPANSQCILPVVEYLRDYASYHFERPLKSYAFLASLLEPAGRA